MCDDVKMVRSVVFRHCPPRLVDDAVSETLLRCWSRYGEITEEGVHQVARSAVRDVYWSSLTPLSGVSGITVYRDVRAGKADFVNYCSTDYGDFDLREREAHEESAQVDVRSAMELLPDKEREALLLLYYSPVEGTPHGKRSFNLVTMSYSDVGRVLGLTEAAVRYREKRALGRLKELLLDSAIAQ